MKSRLIHRIGMKLLLSLVFLMGYGIAQATPVCNPDYSLNLVSGVVTSVTLSANCTPDPGQSINAATGYKWNPALDNTSSPQPIAIADGTTYQVQATEDGTNYGPWASVTVHTGSPLSCNLSAMVAGTLQSSVSIGNGQSATLVPNCPGALSGLAWYAAAPNSTAAGTLISTPTGGVVSPTSSTAYYVVGANDVSDTASNAVTVTVSPAQVAPQASCSLTASAPSVISGTSVTLTASNIQNADTYTWAGLSCSGTTCSINPTATNTYTLNVSKADSSSTPGSCSTSVTVGKGSQTISFGSAPSITAGGIGSVSATATSGLAVAFSSQTTSVCTVSGSTVSGVSAGTCTIAANQAGNASYNAAPQVTQSFSIGSASKTSQTISFGSAPSITAGGTGSVSATATSGLAVAFSSQTTSVCTVSGSIVTGVSAGTCTIAANQAGNASYNAAPQQTQSFSISAASSGGGGSLPLGCTGKGNTSWPEAGNGTPTGANPTTPTWNQPYGTMFSFTSPNYPMGGHTSLLMYLVSDRTMSISSQPCDFSNPQAPATGIYTKGTCIGSGTTSLTIPVTVVSDISTVTPTSGCYLQAGQTYYYNLVNTSRTPGSHGVSDASTRAQALAAAIEAKAAGVSGQDAIIQSLDMCQGSALCTYVLDW